MPRPPVRLPGAAVIYRGQAWHQLSVPGPNGTSAHIGAIQRSVTSQAVWDGYPNHPRGLRYGSTCRSGPGSLLAMTQTQNAESETDRCVANLTASIRKTTGATRDSQARALLEHVDIDLVSMLVAASERYQVAEKALISAEKNLTAMIDALKNMTRLGPRGENRDAATVLAMVAVFSAAREYVAALNLGDDQSRLLAKRLFGQATRHIADLMATDDARGQLPARERAGLRISHLAGCEVRPRSGG